MSELPYRSALIVGVGSGISASVARALSSLGVQVALAARDTGKLESLAGAARAQTFAADAADPRSVRSLFDQVASRMGEPEVVVYNAAVRISGPLAELDAEAVRKSLMTTAYGAFLVTQQAARLMIPRKSGAILLTGATAGVKGFAQSAPFAMGKFALRGLAQSAARELGPLGIHVAHFIIDGAVRSDTRPEPTDRPDSTLDPEAIAQSYVDVLRQPRSAWSSEIELRPWVERF